MFTNSRHDLVFITQVDCVLCEIRHDAQQSRAYSTIGCKQVLELRDTEFKFHRLGSSDENRLNSCC